MNPMDIFWLIWGLFLPLLGIILPILFGVFWFFVVPPIARMFAWNRFKNVSFHAVADDSGYVELVPTKEELPEGMVLTKKGWRMIPRAIPDNPGKKGPIARRIEDLALKAYILKGIGKIIWFDYAGKITSMNPGLLASLQQNDKTFKLKPYFERIEKIVDDLPRHLRKELTTEIKKLKEATKAKPITNLNLNKIKSVVQKLYPPSVWKAFGINRYMKGMDRKGKQYTSLILGGAIIIGLVVLGIAVIMFLK